MCVLSSGVASLAAAYSRTASSWRPSRRARLAKANDDVRAFIPEMISHRPQASVFFSTGLGDTSKTAEVRGTRRRSAGRRVQTRLIVPATYGCRDSIRHLSVQVVAADPATAFGEATRMWLPRATVSICHFHSTCCLTSSLTLLVSTDRGRFMSQDFVDGCLPVPLRPM